ncbi:MAG TPA: hypothetical protein VMG55_06065 [Stellaceae bacterium]|nr:hypothetical protein [Stellaceae bacterium]
MTPASVALDFAPLDLAESEPPSALDLVTLTILAVNCLGPATMRSATYGKAHRVVVSDPRVGAVFRAALDLMGETRRTDRLIEVVVETDGVSAA